MKVILKFLSIAVFLFLFVVIGCRKDLSLKNETELVNSFSNKEAKEWFYGNFKKSAEFLEYNETYKKLPDWNHCTYRKVGEMEIIEFTLSKENKSIVIESDNKLSVSNRERLVHSSLFRIMFIKTSDGKITIREIVYIPTFDYLTLHNFDISNLILGGTNNNFSGKIITKKWSGDVLSTLFFENGEIVGELSTKEKPSVSKQKSTPTTSFDEGCGYVEFCNQTEMCQANLDYNTGDFISWVVPPNCHFEYNNCTTVLYCPWGGGSTGGGTSEPPACNYGLSESCECQLLQINCGGNGEGSGGNGGGSPSPNSVTTVVNNVTNPCLNQVYDKIKNNGFKSKIGIFLQIFAGNPNINIQINGSTTMASHEYASTTWNESTDTYNIDLNLNNLPQCSQEFIADTYFHEIIHLYLKNNLDSYNFENISAHTEMLNNYFTDLINATMSSYPNLSQLSAFAIAWEGVALAGVDSPVDNILRNTLKNQLLIKINSIYPGTDASMLEGLVEQHQEGGSAGTRNPTCN